MTGDACPSGTPAAGTALAVRVAAAAGLGPAAVPSPACVPARIRLVEVRSGEREEGVMVRVRGPKSVQVGLNLYFLQISGTWEPNEDERKAAWELHVELVTRIAVVPLGADDGLLRE